MFGMFKSKEEKLLREYEPAIAELLFKQIHQAFQVFVGGNGEKMGAFVFRVNSTEAHGYIFSFIEAYCRAILSDDFPSNTFGKIYMTTVGSVWRRLFEYDLMKIIPNISLGIDGDALDVSDCWSDYVNNEHDPRVENAKLRGRMDCAALVVYDEFPNGLEVILSTANWDSPPMPISSKPANDTDHMRETKNQDSNKVFDIVLVPDLGGFKDLEVVEVLVSVGDHVGIDDSLIVIESDIAFIEIPSTLDGIVEKIYVQMGEKLSQGLPICSIRL